MTYPELSPRQAEALALVGEGLSIQEIAGEMGISRSMAKQHLDKLRAKFGVQVKRELIPLARKR